MKVVPVATSLAGAGTTTLGKVAAAIAGAGEPSTPPKPVAATTTAASRALRIRDRSRLETARPGA
ncbi:hypothetical protein GCM10009839_39790 [Catenulispora yoronensis]|uniref:Uncharacterized protein n=1 Tax=Catenulispora yoronensis TaxID=450799 RepID=A0ABP5FVR0_9ACTN